MLLSGLVLCGISFGLYSWLRRKEAQGDDSYGIIVWPALGCLLFGTMFIVLSTW